MKIKLQDIKNTELDLTEIMLNNIYTQQNFDGNEWTIYFGDTKLGEYDNHDNFQEDLKMLNEGIGRLG